MNHTMLRAEAGLAFDQAIFPDAANVPEGVRVIRQGRVLQLDLLHPRRSLAFYFSGITACCIMFVLGVLLVVQGLYNHDSSVAISGVQWTLAGAVGQVVITILAWFDWRAPQQLRLMHTSAGMTLHRLPADQVLDLDAYNNVLCWPGGRLRLSGAGGAVTVLKGLTREEQHWLQQVLREALLTPGGSRGGSRPVPG